MINVNKKIYYLFSYSLGQDSTHCPFHKDVFGPHSVPSKYILNKINMSI